MARRIFTRNTKIGRSVLPIALVFGYDRRGSTDILRGIGRYARGCDNWALVSLVTQDRLLEAVRAIKPAGIIIGEFITGVADVLRKAGWLVVNTTSRSESPRIPQVTIAEASIGAMAAKHLIECGLRNFGYFGPPWGGLTCEREGGFHQTLQRFSYTAEVCYVRPSVLDRRGGAFASHKNVCRWLAEIPKPAGIFAPNDAWALWLCGVCKQEDIKVPEEIAIIGADNDELLCELSQPTLSSVVFPDERIGYEAAAMLDRLINKEPVSNKPLLLPAVGVMTRQSTDVLAVADPDLITAINYMREHICEPIKIEDMLQLVHLPRWSFERKFREALGRSPTQEICRMRLEAAKTLLSSNPEMKTASISHRCGFSHMTHFFRAFHQATGMTPAEYRRAMGQESNRGTSSANSSAKRH